MKRPAGGGAWLRGRRRRAAVWAAAITALGLWAACARRPPLEATGAPAESFSAYGRQAVVATADARASQAGLEMIQRGGNVVDAFAAASFAVSVARPQSTGIGGGGFAVLWLRQEGGGALAIAVDFRERAPAAARRDMFAAAGVAANASRVGALSVATPGLVAGVLSIHERLGRLSRAEVMAPAIQLAEEGFPVYAALAKAIDGVAADLRRHPESARLFVPRGRPLEAGAPLRQPELGATLRAIAAEGKQAFYAGPIAQRIAGEVRRLGGVLAESDLAEYRVLERPVLRGAYGGYEILSMPPPSAGGVLMLEMFNMLRVAGPSAAPGLPADRAHLLAEIMRRAYEDRARYLGDPDFVAVPVDRLVSLEHARERWRDFQPRRASSRGAAPAGDMRVTSTTHISILDAAGNAVAATETINFSFGSTITVPGTGIVLNNEMDDFATLPNTPNLYGLVGTDANAVAPGKTPLSSMSPTIVARDGVPLLVAGSPGGSLIVTATLQTILNVLDLGMPLDLAVAAPRLHHQAVPDQLAYEPGAIDAAAAADLAARGHTLRPFASMGNVQAVMRLPSGDLVGVSDPRAEGRPAAY